MEGGRLDRYELQRVLGIGSFATVWLAHDPVVGLDLAVKVLADNWARDPEMRRRFLEEGRHAMQVTSPRLVRVHGVDESDDGVPFMVMSLADRGSLETRIDRQGPFELDVALGYVEELARAVADLHDHNLLHRDLKPGNVLFASTRESGEQLVLGDFGMARALDRSALTLVGGTAAYAAPEQAAGLSQLTRAADVYPLGVMVLEMLTGEMPSSSGSMADAARTTLSPAAHLSEHGVSVPPAVLSLLDDLLAHDPDDRLPDAESVIERVEAVRADPKTAPVERQSVSPALAKKQPFEGSMRIASAALLVVITGVLGWWLLAGRSADPESDGPSTAGTEAATVQPDGQSDASPDPRSDGSESPADAADVPPPPFPPGAVIDDSTTTPNEYAANVSGTVDDTLDFYESLDDAAVARVARTDDSISLTLTDDSSSWAIELSELSLTTGAAVTRVAAVVLSEE